MSLSNGRAKPPPPPHLFLFLLLIARFVAAQPPPSTETPNTTNKNGFNASTAIVIVLLLASFFFLTCFSIYVRTCYNGWHANSSPPADGFVLFQHGLNPLLLQTFPTLIYSEVKPHKLERSELACAICLGEFDGEDVLRLLPACDHVFHLDCIDIWLSSHITCPVCRTNYNLYSPALNDLAAPPETIPRPDVEAAADDAEGRKEEMRELAVLASKVRRSKRLLRSRSTGNLTMAEGEAGFRRYTLRLPENLRKEVVATGSLRKAGTFAAAVGAGEGSMRRDSTHSRGVGEGSSRRGRTIHLGRSDRWPSFFGRSLSARILTFGNRRKGEEGGGKESP